MTQEQAEIIWHALAPGWLETNSYLHDMYLELQAIIDTVITTEFDNDKIAIERKQTFIDKLSKYALMSDKVKEMFDHCSKEPPPSFTLNFDIYELGIFSYLSSEGHAYNDYIKPFNDIIHDPFIVLLYAGFLIRDSAFHAFVYCADEFIRDADVCILYANAKEL